MEEPRRHYEAKRKRHRVTTPWQLSATSVTMKDREGPDHNSGDPDRRPRRQRYHETKCDRRHRDADLHAGQAEAENAEHAAACHYQRKHDRQDPDRARPEEGTPQSAPQHAHEVAV